MAREPLKRRLLHGNVEAMRSRIELARVGPLSTGLSVHKRLQPLAIKKMPLAAPPPRDNRFGRPLELAKVQWIRPRTGRRNHLSELAEDGLLRHTVLGGLREEKPAREVQRETPRTN